MLTMERQIRIEQCLRDSLQPLVLEVVNESGNHNVKPGRESNPGRESHFNVTAVAEEFDQMNRLARHRRIYQLLADELQNGLHALVMHLYSPREWNEVKDSRIESPPCRGGSAATSPGQGG